MSNNGKMQIPTMSQSANKDIQRNIQQNVKAQNIIIGYDSLEFLRRSLQHAVVGLVKR